VRVFTYAIVLASGLFALVGCVQEVRQRGEESTVVGAYNNPLTWLREAQRHEEQGDLQRALYEYRLAKTVSHSDYTVLKHVRRVEARIEERTAMLLKQAERADTRGRVSEARKIYLEILSLKPGHRQALAALRRQEKERGLLEMEKKRVLARQRHQKPQMSRTENAYSDEDYDGASQEFVKATSQPIDARKLLENLKRHKHKPAKDDQRRRQEVEANLAQADKAYHAQHWDDALGFLLQAELTADGEASQLQAIEKVRKEYAEELYSQGVISYRSEPQQARSYWRQALKFDPENEKSRLRIRNMSLK
jgi:tetratricopeptide (TPR) repeat protein